MVTSRLRQRPRGQFSGRHASETQDLEAAKQFFA